MDIKNCYLNLRREIEGDCSRRDDGERIERGGAVLMMRMLNLGPLGLIFHGLGNYFVKMCVDHGSDVIRALTVVHMLERRE
jgi:hypothetical protein